MKKYKELAALITGFKMILNAELQDVFDVEKLHEQKKLSKEEIRHAESFYALRMINTWEDRDRIVVIPADKENLPKEEIYKANVEWMDSFALAVPSHFPGNFHVCLVTQIENLLSFCMFGKSCFWFFARRDTGNGFTAPDNQFDELFHYIAGMVCQVTHATPSYLLRLAPDPINYEGVQPISKVEIVTV